MKLVFASATFVATLGAGYGVAPAPRVARMPPRVRAVPPSNGRAPATRLRHVTASCATSTTGSNAFDSSTTFQTNQVESFGAATLAAAYNSGAFEGGANQICDADAMIGAGYGNFIDSGEGANAGGAGNSFIGAGVSNLVSATASFIGAGGSEAETQLYANQVAATDAFIGAGDFNSVGSAGNGGFVGGGGYAWAANGNKTVSNEVDGEDSFVGAGDANHVLGALDFVGAGEFAAIAAGADYGAIVGGYQNSVEASFAFVGAGDGNIVGSAGAYAAILGGFRNTAAGEYASVAGGYGNTAKGKYASVAGGYGDTAAGQLSFAAGYHADAVNSGSFVWSDYSAGSALVKDAKPNQFVVRASGGTYVYSNEAASAGVELSPGSGTWAMLSDRSAKTDVVPLDDESILAKVAALPIGAWSYRSERGVRHVGPMAQDFYAAFGTGVDDRHITSIDEDGVALAAIKALDRRNARLEAKNALLGERLAKLEAKVAALAATRYR